MSIGSVGETSASNGFILNTTLRGWLLRITERSNYFTWLKKTVKFKLPTEQRMVIDLETTIDNDPNNPSH